MAQRRNGRRRWPREALNTSAYGTSMLEALSDLFGQAQQALFEGLVQPLAFALGLGGWLEDAFDATGWLLVGLLQVALMATVLAGLERWRPVEPVTDRAAVRVDVLYTLLHRLGLFRLLLFFSLHPLLLALMGQLRVAGLPVLAPDALWPGVTDVALVSFFLYLLLFDLLDYGIHRAQHGWRWWWALHALHHSQRQMTVWTDARNHLLDDALRDSLFVLAGLLLGVGPGQFVALLACKTLLETLSHANLRTSFGPVLGRLVVSPRFHRQHHAIGLGHESHGPGSLGGCNFAVLFPLWDLIFGTAYWGREYPATGVRAQLAGHDYGRGFWAQQVLGFKRLLGRGVYNSGREGPGGRTEEPKHPWTSA
jgi:sterol desaturase/sphingolipid hydroxylase (fatty acid hydroxylase superfamily)